MRFLWLLLLFLNSAYALELKLYNRSESLAVLALAYEEPQGKLTVAGWYSLDKGQEALIKLPSVCADYYLHAEFSNGKSLEGAYKFKVDTKAFKYEAKHMEKFSGQEVGFIKALALPSPEGLRGEIVIK